MVYLGTSACSLVRAEERFTPGDPCRQATCSEDAALAPAHCRAQGHGNTGTRGGPAESAPRGLRTAGPQGTLASARHRSSCWAGVQTAFLLLHTQFTHTVCPLTHRTPHACSLTHRHVTLSMNSHVHTDRGTHHTHSPCCIHTPHPTHMHTCVHTRVHRHAGSLTHTCVLMVSSLHPCVRAPAACAWP